MRSTLATAIVAGLLFFTAASAGAEEVFEPGTQRHSLTCKNFADAKYILDLVAANKQKEAYIRFKEMQTAPDMLCTIVRVERVKVVVKVEVLHHYPLLQLFPTELWQALIAEVTDEKGVVRYMVFSRHVSRGFSI
jgi:hypothetical protein